MHLFKSFVVVATAWALMGVGAQAAPLRVAIEGDGAYAPFSFFKADKSLTGFDIEITNALCQHISEGCEIIPVNFEVIVDGLAKGTYDVSISSMGYTPERAAKIMYGPAYYRSHDIFVGRTDKFKDTSPEALKTMRLASAQGTTQQKYLVEHYTQSVILEGKDLNDAYDKLVDGTVDLVLADSIVHLDFLQSNRGADFSLVGEPTRSENPDAAFITFRKGLEDKAEEFSEALKHIRLDGTYDRINRNFVPFNIY